MERKFLIGATFLLFLTFFYTPPVFSNKTFTPKTSISSKEVQVKHTDIIVRNIEHEITLHFKKEAFREFYEGKTIDLQVNGQPVTVEIKKGKATFPWKFSSETDFTIHYQNFEYQTHINPIPLWFSVIPPLIAILFALIFKEVYSALFIGILIGTTTIYAHQGVEFFTALFKGIFAIPDTYVLESLGDKEHLSIIVFTMLIGGMVGIITKNGGMKGVVNILSKYAKSARSGQFVTWLLGIAIFFDDYANTLVVGNTMRPVTDRLRISREKLAYIVDSTAAPIAAIAFVTTWIGAELSYIQDGINTLGLNQTPYNVFINSLAYSFYPIFALLFILMLTYKGRDFGPMLRAEKRARQGKVTSNTENDDNDTTGGSEIETPEHIQPKAYNAVIPVAIVIFGTFIGLLYTGWDPEVWSNPELAFSKKLSVIIGNSDSFKALLWSSILGVVVAILFTVIQKLLNLKKTIDTLIDGFKTMLTAIIILVLAWSLALLTKHLHTADFISQSLVSINLVPFLVPALTFILAALVAFSTGSSWGTMAILYPLILPASWLISQEAGLENAMALTIFYNVVSCVLAGSVLGDHCSPISDTTILSSLASSCNHIEHVRTQMPYALTVGGISIAVGTIPSAYGIPSYITFPAGLLLLFLIVHFFGKKSMKADKLFKVM
ncbi:MAG: Na+/H+ antiporter NhaC family protein [Bacteroidales bacterium]|nr:Na+/H+ antiporter NhaC family protein [Bacteroidales bacterium]